MAHHTKEGAGPSQHAQENSAVQLDGQLMGDCRYDSQRTVSLV
jgi:hypothetical protein